MQQALVIREVAYGPEDPRTALPLHDLGILRLQDNRYTEAEPLLLRALTVRENSLDPNHYCIAESLEACTDLYRKLDRPSVADTMELRAAMMRRQ